MTKFKLRKNKETGVRAKYFWVKLDGERIVRQGEEKDSLQEALTDAHHNGAPTTKAMEYEGEK